MVRPITQSVNPLDASVDLLRVRRFINSVEIANMTTLRARSQLRTLRGFPVIGSLRSWLSGPWDFLTVLSREHDGVTQFSLGPHRVFFVWQPDHVRQVMTERGDIFTRETRQYAIMRRGLGNGMVTSNGDHWRRSRKLVQPHLAQRKVQRFSSQIIRCTQDALNEIPPGKTVDFARVMTQLTLRIVCSTLFSVDVADSDEALGRHLDQLIDQANSMVSDPFELPAFVPTPRHRKFEQSLKVVNQFIEEAIRERIQSTSPADDLLTALIHAHDPETGESFSVEDVLDEALTLCVAGYETTALVLTWTAFLLARYPAVHDKLIQDGNCDEAQPESLLANTRLQQILFESMRLFPPSWLITRSVSQRTQIDGVTIPQGSNVFLSPFVNHRHPALWNEPEEFQPDRFDPGHPAESFSYFPFGAGSHYCVGRTLGMLEATLISGMLFTKYRPHLTTNGQPQFFGSITLRPQGGMPLRFEEIK